MFSQNQEASPLKGDSAQNTNPNTATDTMLHSSSSTSLDCNIAEETSSKERDLHHSINSPVVTLLSKSQPILSASSPIRSKKPKAISPKSPSKGGNRKRTTSCSNEQVKCSRSGRKTTTTKVNSSPKREAQEVSFSDLRSARDKVKYVKMVAEKKIKVSYVV